MAQSQERGVQLHHPAKAVAVHTSLDGELVSVRLASLMSGIEEHIPCARIIIAAGAWSPQVFKTLFPTAKAVLPITSLGGHSLVVRSPRWAKAHEKNGCHAVFTTGEGFSPEIFSRMGDEIYVAGLNSSTIPLPDLATESIIEDDSISRLHEVSKLLLGVDGGVDDLQIIRKGLCFRPVTSTGTPILARVEDKKLGMRVKTKGGGQGGVFVATGHGPWGISLSLGTGKVMSELVMGVKTSADISGLGF